MHTYDKTYDVIVIGAGHAGCEAALVSSRMGAITLLMTISLDSIARMSCNPAIGGLAKGHIVREIDALGGEMAKVTDTTAVQFRMLNKKNGPAVWAPRAQSDKNLYHIKMKEVLENQPNLDIKQQLVEEIILSGTRACGIRTQSGEVFQGKAIIIATGTFLNGLIHIGEVSYKAGRASEVSSEKLSDSLKSLGFELGRLKTGTPPRINKNSIDFSKLIKQQGDEPPSFFSYSTKETVLPQVACYITYTNKNTHEFIKNNLHRSPLYSGKIKGIGPRYCPSIEDKVVRFADKDRHQLFLEPEGLDSQEIYVNGLSTSLPQDVQEKLVKTISGLENAEIVRFGYAIEYDFVPPTQIKPSLETKLIDNLFFAGQINGTSGYEEAACQGLMAGINAVLKLKGEEPFVLERSEAYIGVLIDDLTTKGTNEPYRMFTSRAEHRLILRQDNADLRLTDYGHKFGLVPKEAYDKFLEKRRQIKDGVEFLKAAKKDGATLNQLLKKPEVKIRDLRNSGIKELELPDDVLDEIEIEIKYDGYIRREFSRIDRMKKLETRRIPEGFSFEKINGLRKESLEKLKKIQPRSVGQASRISGISPCDISLLLVHLEAHRR